ncbi:reverse transcriptase family protein [Hyphomicrobium sp. ghe19]|uniref:reverse transcriptase family protein n=1 Tax=Hyphomicrobium sp. ghe19 TaxID=2682968 RepID=UPI0030CCBF94
MTIWRPQQYHRAADKAATPAEISDNAIATIEALRRRSRNVPEILSLRHLSVRAGVPYAYLREIVERNATRDYRLFRIRKRPVRNQRLRYRIITVPEARLKKVQQWIDRHVLCAAEPDEASVAFTKRSSVYAAASIHCGARWMIKIDIRAFFESISERQVYHVFHEIGYQPLVAFELARLCTRLRRRAPPLKRWSLGFDRRYEISAYINGQVGHVPQGAPTSPRLSNLVVRELDEDIRTIAASAGLTYTRYADDLTLSKTTDDFSRAAAVKVIRKIYRVLGAHGFAPNLAKTQIVPPRARKIVLGLLVDGDRPRLQREFKARIRQHLHYLMHPKFGPAKHAKAQGNATIYGLRNHIKGLLAFAHGVDPEYARKQTELFNRVHWP